MDRENVENLSCAAVDVKPREFDFGQGYPERWDRVLPDIDNWTVQQCHEWLDGEGYDAHDVDPNPFTMSEEECREALDGLDVEDGLDLDGLRHAAADAISDSDIDGIDEWRDKVREVIDHDDKFAPMMNYLYPLPELGDARDAQTRVAGSSLVIVMVDDDNDNEPETPYLALAGGGMDFSWEICEAYMLLGYLPPFHYTDLPRMAGKGESERDRWVVAGCKRTCEVIKGLAGRRLEHLTMGGRA